MVGLSGRSAWLHVNPHDVTLNASESRLIITLDRLPGHAREVEFAHHVDASQNEAETNSLFLEKELDLYTIRSFRPLRSKCLFFSDYDQDTENKYGILGRFYAKPHILPHALPQIRNYP
jgi:hypothetical protein